MPETFDLRTTLDDLVSDVSRAAGPGDPRVPPRRARRRRALAGAMATVVAVTLGVTALQVVGDDAPDSAPDIAERRSEPSPGLERRERLLGLLPSDSSQISMLDVAGFTGGSGLSPDDAGDREIVSYVLSSFLTLQRGPFARLLLPELVTYAGTGATDLFLVDRDPAEVTRGITRAGWVDDSGVLVPGERVSRLDGRLAPYVLVAEEDGRALVVLARERRDLPELGEPTPEPGVAGAALATLGGAVGYSLGFSGSCTLQAVTLTSASQGLVLVGPPPGTAPEDVEVGDLEVPTGISSIDFVTPEGEQLVAGVTVPGPGGPLEVRSRLGLPGTEFC